MPSEKIIVVFDLLQNKLYTKFDITLVLLKVIPIDISQMLRSLAVKKNVRCLGRKIICECLPHESNCP